MGYDIKYEEMRTYYLQAESWALSMMELLTEVSGAWERFCDDDGMEGEGADALRAYAEEYHMTITAAMQMLLTDFHSRLLLYIDDYYTNIDDSMETRLCEDALSEHMQDYKRELDTLETFDGELKTALQSIASICDIGKPDFTGVREIGENLILRTQRLEEAASDMEEAHKKDAEGPEALLEEINGIVSKRCWQPNTRCTDYEAGSICRSIEFEELKEIYAQEGEQIRRLDSRISRALEHEEIRKLADVREAKGFSQIWQGAGKAFAGALGLSAAIALTGPFGAALGTFVGISSVLSIGYGGSEMWEGRQHNDYGRDGDTETEAFNPGVAICGGNELLYHGIGETAVFISSFADMVADGYAVGKEAKAFMAEVRQGLIQPPWKRVRRIMKEAVEEGGESSTHLLDDAVENTLESGSKAANKIGNSDTMVHSYTRDEIINSLNGVTPKSTEIANSIQNGKIKINVLGDELFESYLGCSSDTMAMQVGNQIYVRSSSASLFSDVVHEGVHAMDFINGVDESVISSWSGETSAYSAERLFQLESGMQVQFESEEDMMVHIWSNYKK